MKKILTIIGIVLLLLILSSFTWLYTGISLPDKSEAVIEQVMAGPPKNIVIGTTGFVYNKDTKIWYEYIPAIDSTIGTILLVMGHSTSGLQWSDYFYNPLRQAGYDIIRYDNRGVGLSDWMVKWDKSKPYNLEDMAIDGMSILDHLDISKAHIIGVSMGGMIAQRMAISYPDRVLSLGSIMTSGYMGDPELTTVTPSFISNITKVGLRYLTTPSDKNFIRFNIGIAEVLRGKGDYNYNVEAIANRTLYQLKYHGGFNTNVKDQHTTAIEISGSRYNELRTLNCPTVVIHGTSDPLVLPEHSKKYEPMIPDAEMVWIEGMGHDIPEAYVHQLHTALLTNFKRSRL